MAPSRADELATILLLVGDTPDGRVSANLISLWNRNAAKESLGSGLQSLYTRRDAQDVLLAYYQDQVDQVTGPMQERLHQRVDTLQTMRGNTEREILRIEDIARKRRGGASVAITQVVPALPLPPSQYVPPATGDPDPNNPDYAGTPYPPGEFIP